VKTDAVDAPTLAHLLRTGLLPEAYIAPPELRDLRDLLRHRATLVHLRTSVKNRVHALLARQGILPDHTDLFGTAGREFLAAVALPDGPRRRLDSLISLIGDSIVRSPLPRGRSISAPRPTSESSCCARSAVSAATPRC
jgi:transposase